MLFITVTDTLPEPLSEVNMEKLVELVDEHGAVLVLEGGSTAYPVKVYFARQIRDVDVLVSEAESGEVIYDSEKGG